MAEVSGVELSTRNRRILPFGWVVGLEIVFGPLLCGLLLKLYRGSDNETRDICTFLQWN